MISPEIAAELPLTTPAVQRSLALIAVDFAMSATALDEPVAQLAHVRLRTGQPVEPALRAAVRDLAQRLDEEYWAVHDAADRGAARREEQQAAFSKARAAATIDVAIGADALDAADDALYEAAFTGGDTPALLESVAAALRGA